jgi:hypothetical protein
MIAARERAMRYEEHTLSEPAIVLFLGWDQSQDVPARGETSLDRKLQDEIIVAVEDVIRSIAEGEYETLEAGGRAGRFSADDLRHAIASYGRTLVIPPNEVLEEELLREAVPIRGEGGSWALVADLWMAEEEAISLSS